MAAQIAFARLNIRFNKDKPLNFNAFSKLLIITGLCISAHTGWAKSLAEMLGHGEDSGQPALCQDAATPPTPKCAKAPSADFDAKGRLWVSWVFQDRVYVQSSADGGKTLGKPVAVNLEPEKILAKGENRPKIKLGSRGQIFLSWSKSLEKGFSSDVRFSRSLDGGKTFSEPVTVNDDRQTIGHSFDSLGISRDGKVFIAWLDARDAEAAKDQGKPYNGTALYYTWSGNDGTSFVPGVKAADHTCECCRVQTDMDRDGMPVMTWRNIYPENIRDPALVKLSDWDKPGTPIRAGHENWYIEGCPHHGPSLSIADGGRYHLAWFSNAPDAQGLFYAHSDDSGAHFSDPLPFGNAKASPKHAHVLAHGQEVRMVWLESDGARSLLKTMRSDDAGASWSAPALLAESESEADSPFLHVQGGKAYVSWATKSDGLRVIRIDESR